MFDAIRVADYKYTDAEERFLSKEVRELLKLIMNPNARKRYSLQEIKEHPWFTVGIENHENLHFEYNVMNYEDKMRFERLANSENKSRLF